MLILDAAEPKTGLSVSLATTRYANAGLHSLATVWHRERDCQLASSPPFTTWRVIQKHAGWCAEGVVWGSPVCSFSQKRCRETRVRWSPTKDGESGTVVPKWKEDDVFVGWKAGETRADLTHKLRSRSIRQQR